MITILINNIIFVGKNEELSTLYNSIDGKFESLLQSHVTVGRSIIGLAWDVMFS